MNSITRFACLVLTLGVALLFFHSPAARAGVSYTVTDMRTLARDTDSQAEGINSKGQVVGESLRGKGDSTVLHAVVWQNGKVERLPVPKGFRESNAYSISDNGTIVGCVYNDFFENGRAVVWTHGRARLLPNLHGFRYGVATAINSSGDIAGYCLTTSDYPNAQYRPVLWRNNRVQNLGSLGGSFGYGRGINNAGLVVGDTDTHINHVAFVWRQGALVMLTLPNTPIGLLASESSVTCINSAGDMAGWSGDLFPHACVWHNDRGELVPAYNGKYDVSWANAINDSGQVAGYWHGGEYGARDYAFLFSGGKVVDLDTVLPPQSGWKLLRAQGINNKGEIVGFGRHGGRERAFLLRPAQ